MFKLFLNLTDKTRALIVLLVGLIILCAVNFTIYQRELLLKEGRVVLLELAPIDPRSLMQGDYMALRFQIVNEAFPGTRWAFNGVSDAAVAFPQDGTLVVSIDEHQVGRFQRIARGHEVLKQNEILMRYRIRNDQVKFGTNAFFFEEGQAQLYERARYGAFRVAANGDMILTSLHNADYSPLQKQGVSQANTH